MIPADRLAEILARVRAGTPGPPVVALADITALLAEVEALRKAAEAVEALHRPTRVYDECEHEDCEANPIEVYDYLACDNSAIGWGCETCCYDGDMPIEDCPHGADHRGVTEGDSCPTHAALTAWREADR